VTLGKLFYVSKLHIPHLYERGSYLNIAYKAVVQLSEMCFALVSALWYTLAVPVTEHGEGREQIHSELSCEKGRHFQQVLVVGEDIPGRKDTEAGNWGS